MEHLRGNITGEEPEEKKMGRYNGSGICAQMRWEIILSVIPSEAIRQMIVELNALCQ